MQAIVLGSAAGGGSPQWNCRCGVCDLAWSGDPRVQRRTQSSLAVAAGGTDWALFNCSPDIREQIGFTSVLWPRRRGRDSPIRAMVLSNGDIDHVGGLLSLRERTPFTVWATNYVLEALLENPIFRALSDGLTSWRPFSTDVPFEPLPGLEVVAFMTPGKVPLYNEGDAPVVGECTDANVGFEIGAPGGRRLLYVPGCAAVDEALLERARAADVILFDGTLYSDRELIDAGVGQKTGRRMGHVSISGSDGSLAAFEGIECGRRIYVHLNNTNPVLVAGSPQRRAVEAAGWQVGYDGMKIEL